MASTSGEQVFEIDTSALREPSRSRLSSRENKRGTFSAGQQQRSIGGKARDWRKKRRNYDDPYPGDAPIDKAKLAKYQRFDEKADFVRAQLASSPCMRII